jgi:hypothetical protein
MKIPGRIWNAIKLCDESRSREILEARIKEVELELSLLKKEIYILDCDVPDFTTRIGRLGFLILRKAKRTHWRDSSRTLADQWNSTAAVNWNHE